MKKAFRWGCVILSVITVCAWAFLLVGAKQPWKNIGVNETPDSPAETKPGENEIKKNAALSAKAEIASPGERDRMLDLIAVQQEQQQQVAPEIHGTANMPFMGPGPAAAKSRHHRAKKSSENDADSSAEETEETEKTDGAVLASADDAQDSRLVQTLISANPSPSTPALSLLPTMGLSVPSAVNNTTQTLVERLTAPVGTTVNDLTRVIATAPRTSLQTLVYTTQSAIPASSTVGTIVGNTTLQASVQTLTSQTLGTVSSVSGTVPAVSGTVSSIGSSTPISGSPISSTVISPSSTSTVAVSPSSTSSFGISPTSVSSTTVSSSTFSSTAISPAVTTSVPTSLSSTLGTTIAPKTSLNPSLPGGH